MCGIEFAAETRDGQVAQEGEYLLFPKLIVLSFLLKFRYWTQS